MSENDYLPCPGCHSPLPPEATGCQICMRGRSKQEIVRGYAKLSEEKARKRRRPFQLLAAVLVLGGGGKLYVDHGEKLKTAVMSAGGAIYRRFDDMRNPSNYASTPVPTPAPAPPVEPEKAVNTQLFAADPPPAAPAPAQGSPQTPAAAARAAPKPPAKNAWRVSGEVYDLATLTPVPGAVITFRRDGQEPASVTTDGRGLYEIDLAKGAAWAVSLEAGNHRRGQILDIDPPYRDRDADERRAVLQNISDGDLAPAQLDWKRSDKAVRLDLIVVPAYWTGPPSR